MNRHVRWFKLAFALLIMAAMLLPGCARQAMPLAANAAAQAAVPVAPDKDATLKYLKSALKDLAIIDKLIEDKELELTVEADPNSDEEMSEEEAARYTELLNGYIADIKAAIEAIGKREAPDNADIASFTAAELQEFELASELLDEYLQVLGYYDLMMEVSDDLAQLEKVDSADLEGMYKTYNEAITKAADTLKNGTIPSCLKSFNDSMIVALNDMNASVLYLLSSVALDDPMRQAAAVYRWGILMRKFEKVSASVSQDLADRQTKLTADAKSIQKTNDGLKQWLQSNIDKLK